MLKRLLLLLGVFIAVLLIVTGWLIWSSADTRQLTGVVVDAETRVPLQGVELAAGDARTRTNERGEYALAFQRGRRALAANLDGYLPARQDVDGTDVFARAFTVDVDLIANRVTGYVLDAETNQTLGNAPLRMGERLVTANAQGAFEARAVKNGTPIAVQFNGYQAATVTFEGQENLNIFLAPSTMTVTVADLTGRPVPNAEVKAGEVSGVTDAQGRVVLRRILPGTTLRATAAGFESNSSLAPAAGSEVRLALRPNVLDGTVTDAATGQPITNTLVYLGSTIVATNSKGAFHIEPVPPQATITLKAPGYAKAQVEITGASRRDVKLTPFNVKGIHIPFGMLPDEVFANMDLAKKTELNAIVLDVKAEKGRVAWDSQVLLAKQIEAPYLKWMDLSRVVERCRADHVYCIARLPVFQDTLLATARPDLALRFPNGTVYSDSNGSAWTNAASSAVWDYNIALAKEVTALGFDEIQFDYIRFPGRVDLLYTGATATEEGRRAAIAGFLARAQKELRPTGVFISADVFGLTTASDDEQYTGQRLRDLGPYVDYISPMVYPDVWNDAGYLLSNGLKIPNCTVAVRCPYEVIYNSYKRATEKTGAKVRLWLQAYTGRGNFGVTQYRLQKKAAEDAGSVGWTFWSGAGTYSISTFDPR